LSKQENVIEETNEIYDRYELVKLRFKLAYMKYKMQKWKQGKENEEEKEKI
jgi:uncharacterized coiled-coil protein SlyX